LILFISFKASSGVVAYPVIVGLFIGAWSVFPIGQEIFEIQFMGIKFFILRALFSIPFVVISSYLLDKFNTYKQIKKM